MTGLRGNLLDWDRKERVTPAKTAHGLSNHRGRARRPSPRKRVAGAELWRSLAAASAVVERRKASALRFQRAPRPLPSFRASGRERGQSAEVGNTRLPAFRFLFFVFCSFFVARMKRSEIRDRHSSFLHASWSPPDFASLHPGCIVRRPIAMNPALHCRIGLTKIGFAAGLFTWRGEQNSDAKKPRRENEISLHLSPRAGRGRARVRGPLRDSEPLA
jgi:hypothetical protein